MVTATRSVATCRAPVIIRRIATARRVRQHRSVAISSAPSAIDLNADKSPHAAMHAGFFIGCRVSAALAHQAELAGADIERKHGGVRYVEALDLAGHVEPRDGAAGFPRQP